MSMTIYTSSDGAVLRDVLNSMAMFLSDMGTFNSATSIAMTLSALAAAAMYIQTANLPVLFKWVVNSMAILYVLLALPIKVNIIDMADDRATYTVSNVPIGLALPAWLSSNIGYGLTMGIGYYFHLPADVDYNKRGMLFGSRIWTGASTMSLKNSPDLAKDLTSYIDQCIFKSKMLSTKQITAEQLKHSDDLITLLFTKPSPVYYVLLHTGENVSCKVAASTLKPQVEKAHLSELKDVATILTKGNTAEAQSAYLSAHAYYTKLSNVGANTLTQNILINALRNAQKNVLAFNGDVGQLMNYTNTTTQQKMRYAEANDFWQAEYQLPLIMSSLWTVAICIFPLVVLVSFFPQCGNVYKYYFHTMVYLWSWPLLFNFIHFCVSSAASHQISLLFPNQGEAFKTGITLANIDLIKSIHSDFALKAGRLTAMVPFLALGVVKGLSHVMNQAAQTFTSQSQQISTGEAQSAATGNISMGNFSGWNMNYDTVNAHKYDTNTSFMSGQTSIQGSSGAIEHINSDGSRSFSVGSAISTSSVSVSGTQGLQQSLSHAKEHALQEMDGYQASLTHSAQSASSHASQFSEAHGRDERLGHGASSTESANAQSALQRLTHRAADISEKTGISFDEAFTGMTRASVSASAGIDTKQSLAGKVLGWTTGANGQLQFSAGGEQTQSDTLRHNSGQDYVISAREAEDIRQDMSSIQLYAKNHHYDTNQSDSENLMIQTGHDFRTMQTASDGYSASLQQSERISDAQSTLESSGAQLTQNLNQEAINYGINRVGLERMRYLEMNPNDAGAQAELAQIKNDFMQEKANAMINHQSGHGVNVKPAETYQQAKTVIESQSRNVPSQYSANAKALSGEYGGNLGISQQDKTTLMNKVNHSMGKISTANAELSSEMANKFRIAEAKGQRAIYDGKDKAQSTPGFNALKKYNHPDKKQ